MTNGAKIKSSSSLRDFAVYTSFINCDCTKNFAERDEEIGAAGREGADTHAFIVGIGIQCRRVSSRYCAYYSNYSCIAVIL